jgi:UDP-3-O-[3-hydroxymyristoyl] glucosamine N-acyltransferase
LANPKYALDLSRSRASAVILARTSPQPLVKSLLDRGVQVLLVDDPYFAFAQVMQAFYIKSQRPLGISPQASMGQGVKLGKDISIHPWVRIEDHVTIADGTVIYPGTFVGEGTEIGRDCLIYPNVTIREKVKIGNRVILHSGVVIGSDGFGCARYRGKHHKIPQVGSVVIEDDVELGANVTVDRAVLGRTLIRRGTKVDNLVQIAHNVVIGEDCLIVAQAGISGSTELGRYVILAGQAGLVGHLKIGDGARVGAQAGVASDVEAGETVSGSVALPHREWLRIQATLPELPDLKKRVKELEKKIQVLEGMLNRREKSDD